VLGVDRRRHRHVVWIDDDLDQTRPFCGERVRELIADPRRVVDPDPSEPARLGDLDEVDWRQLHAVLRVAEERHLLPLDQPEHVVAHHNDLDWQRVLGERREVSATTWRSGYATCAPIAYGSAAIIEHIVPLNENSWPRRSSVRAAHVVTVPESPHRIARSASARPRWNGTASGLIG
jgi:hypothetical protein